MWKQIESFIWNANQLMDNEHLLILKVTSFIVIRLAPLIDCFPLLFKFRSESAARSNGWMECGWWLWTIASARICSRENFHSSKLQCGQFEEWRGHFAAYSASSTGSVANYHDCLLAGVIICGSKVTFGTNLVWICSALTHQEKMN